MPTKPHLDTQVGKLRAAIIDVIGYERYKTLRITACTTGRNADTLFVKHRFSLSRQEVDAILRRAHNHYNLNVSCQYVASISDKEVDRHEFRIRKER